MCDQGQTEMMTEKVTFDSMFTTQDGWMDGWKTIITEMEVEGLS